MNRRNNQTLITLALLFACSLSSTLLGQGQWNSGLSQADIQVEYDDRWLPPRAGGYYPLRVTLKNRGPDANLLVFTDPDEEYETRVAPRCEKRIALAQNATVKFTLYVPVCGERITTVVRVHKNGQELNDLRFNLSYVADSCLPYNHLVIDKDLVDLSIFDSFSLHYFYFENSFLRVSPSQLPDSWLGYSGIDVVIVDAATLVESMDDGQRSELLRWVSTGGALLISNTDQLANQLADVNDAVQSVGWNLKQRWETLNLETRRFVGTNRAKVDFDMRLRRVGILFGTIIACDENILEARSFSNYTELLDRGSRVAETFHSGDTRPALQFAFESIPAKNQSWKVRYGASPKFEATGFLEFLNSGVRKIPVWGFISLITLFAFCIGPLNYLVLRRKNKLGLLLVTTPIIALITSLLLIAWTTVANGTDTRVRLRSISFLDQTSQSMVSQTRMAVFSGVTRRDGLQFEPQTMVTPLWPDGDAFQGGTIDWTDSQVMKNGFLKANNRTQFYLTTPRTERGRLLFDQDGSKMKVRNGLEWNIEYLLVRNKDGKYFFGQTLDAGRDMQLEPATEENFEFIRESLSQQELKSPVPRRNNRNDYIYYYSEEDDYGGQINTNLFEGNFLSRMAKDLSNIPTKTRSNEVIDNGIPESNYLAILSEPPSLDLGIDDISITEQLHVLLGVFE